MDIPSELKIVSVPSIPRGISCPTNQLPQLYKLGLLMQTICEREKGIGLSAVQVGVPLNFFIVKFDEQYRFFLNCEYEPIGNAKEKSIEGCLSIKQPSGEFRYFEVDRFVQIKVKGKELVFEPDLSIAEIELTPTDVARIVFQHEIDHQNAILISDIGKEVYVWKK